MSPEMKQILRGAVVATLGLFVGSLVSGFLPESVTGSVRGWATAFAYGIVSIGEASSVSLTSGLVAVCTVLLAVCLVFGLVTLLVASRKIRRNESTDGPGRLLNAVERIANPLLLGAVGGFVISAALTGTGSQMFASVQWIGPAAVLGVVFAAAIKMLPKKSALDHMAQDQKEKE